MWLSVASQHFWFNIQRTGEKQLWVGARRYVGALQTLTLSLVRQNGLGIQGFLAIIALQTLMLSLVLQNGFGRQGFLLIFALEALSLSLAHQNGFGMQTGGADNIRS